MTEAGTSEQAASKEHEEHALDGLAFGNTQQQVLQDQILSLLDRNQTRKATCFSLMSWKCWASQRNSSPPDDKTIPDFHDVCHLTIEEMDELLAVYVTEIKCRDGQEYLEDSIRGLCHGLQRFLRCFCQYYSKPQIMIMKNYSQFPKFMQAFRKRLKFCKGKKRQAPAKGITKVQEESLWNNGVFGIDSAQALSDTIFFYTVKIFGITAGASLRFVKPENFTFSSDQFGDYVELDKSYADDDLEEPISNYNFAIEIPQTGALRHYANPSNPRTYYNLLNLYMELIKLVPRTEFFGFFLAPQRGMQFKSVSIGRNMLQKKFGMIMRSAGIPGTFTTQALVQSFQPLLLQHGYKVRKSRLYTIVEHIDICRILDPPSGTVDTKKLEMAITKHLLEKGLIGPTDLANLPSSIVASDIPLCASLRKIVTGNNHIQNQPASLTINMSNNNKPHQFHLIPVSMTSLLPQNQLDITKSSSTVIEDSTDEELEDIEHLMSIAIKQEPLEYEIENTGSEESSFIPPFLHNPELNEKEAGLETVNVIPKTEASKRPVDEETNETTESKKPKLSVESETREAKIEYTLTNDAEKKVFKQEINVTDDGLNTFSFSGTSKAGKTSSDLDINLGDYLPENCTIKPEDINLKRIVLPDGGKLELNIKYTLPV